MRKHRVLTAIATLVACWAVAPAAEAAPILKKSIWGPTQVNGQSLFPTYADLGAGLYQIAVNWDQTARTRPSNPTDPSDPAYRWPREVDYAIQEGQRHGIEVSILLINTPSWANRGRGHNWAPDQPQDFADFAAAAARRYPGVRHWMVWAEPSRDASFNPLTPERRRNRQRSPRPLNRQQRVAPRLYARMLDAAYGSLKGVSRANRVIGGNTFTTGDISVFNWIRYMRLPNGRPPRMDLYGHNPFPLARKPNLRRGPFRGGRYGFADFSDLDTLWRWLDRYQRRRLRVFISEFFIPTDHANNEFNFYVSQQTQADWLRAALRIARSQRRIYTLGWFSLYDDPPNGGNGQHGDDVHRGLLDYQGNRKPSYDAYKNG